VGSLELVLAGVAAGLTLLCVFLFRRSAAASATAMVAEQESQALRRQFDLEVEKMGSAAELRVHEAAAAARKDLEEEGREARRRHEEAQARSRERDRDLDRRAERLERRTTDLEERERGVLDREGELSAQLDESRRLQEDAVKALEEVSGLSQEEARVALIERVEQESRDLAARRAQQAEDEVRERSEQTAKNIISMAIQRYAGEYICERTVSVVTLPNDELKGRIIGREGRNIRALEAATGVDFIIDDTPGTIIISAFNPIRREVAKATLETLLEDGRIHPTRVESVVRKAEEEFHKVIKAAGEEAAKEVGVSGVHPEILKLLGALKYRTSYGQNQWQHAIEVAFLAGMMADELGLDVKLAKRAGLLHDIGKVMDQTAEGSHALIGAEFARTHGEGVEVVNAIAAHHEEVPQDTIYAVLAQAADAMSGARPGARGEMMATYTQRLSDLERISNSFPGVSRSYAVQAGREVRVLVENASVTDEEVVTLSRGIAQKIEAEMAYPGQIKVTVIRETRVVQYAR